MKLYIAEKPSVAKEIAKILGATTKQDGYIEGNDVTVTWAFGHLVVVQDPEDYKPEWKDWNCQLPMIPDNFELKVINDSGVKKQYGIVKNLLLQADTVVCATDAGREGELIFRNIYDLSGCKAPLERLWVSSLTEEALTKGLNNLEPGAKYDNLADAARCRAQSDWLVGMNATIGFTTTHKARSPLSLGRVQTPVLKLIVDRRNAIDNFVSTNFWEGLALYRDTTFKATHERFTDKETAEKWCEDLKGDSLTITEIESKEKKELSPLLFDLTELQREMNKRHKWTAADTLTELQKLYEAKHVTYPRTDSRYLSNDILGDLEAVMAKIIKGVEQLEKLELNTSHRAFNDSKVSDHHAVIPTSSLPSNLAEKQQLLYDAVVTRTIACFSPVCIKDTTVVTAKIKTEEFKAKGTIIKQIGWRAIEGETSKDQILPEFKIDESGNCEVSLKDGKTTPPKEYNEASLLTAMETAGKVLDDAEVKETMKDKGLGTPATRASVIENLLRRQYIERSKGNVIATCKGMTVIDILGDSLVASVELTGEWEHKLKQMEQGGYAAEDFMTETIDFTKKLITEIQNPTEANIQKMKVSEENESCGKCPLCSELVLEFPKLYTCRDKECDFKIWKTVAGKKVTSAVAKSIVDKGKSALIKGFKSREGKPFDAHLFWNKEKNSVEFEFTDKDKKGAPAGKKESLGKCPVCSKDVFDMGKLFTCEVRECDFKIWKTVAGKELPLSSVKLIIESGKSDLIGGFISKAKKPFNAFLVWDQKKNQTSFEFEKR